MDKRNKNNLTIEIFQGQLTKRIHDFQDMSCTVHRQQLAEFDS